MGITYEPSIGEQRGPAIDQFAKGLSKALQPNRDFQIGMQKAIGGNPALGQQLADLEYNAPGTLDSLGFGDLGKVIAAMPESPAQTARRSKRGDIVGAEAAKLQGANTQSGIDLERINNLKHFIDENKGKPIMA